MDILKILKDDLKDGAKTIHDKDLDDNMRRSIEEIERLRKQVEAMQWRLKSIQQLDIEPEDWTPCRQKEVDDLRKQIDALRWRPINEAPKIELVDLVLFNGTDVKAGQYWEGYWVDSFSDYIDPQPTHYMPLPPAPEE